MQRILTRRRALQFLTWSTASLLALAQPAAKPLAVAHVTVIDGAGAVLRNQTVLASGQRVAIVGKAGRVVPPAGTQVIDGRGRFAIPGLWDMHAHLSYTRGQRFSGAAGQWLYRHSRHGWDLIGDRRVA